MSDNLALDQEDFFHRLRADEALADVEILLQRKGVTESDIQTALNVLNSRGGLSGAVAIVLMPELANDAAQTPAARYIVKATVQVIEQPLVNLGPSGTGLSAERIAERVRQLLHFFATGRGGTYTFESMAPLPVADGQISYGVSFRRMGGDDVVTKADTPILSARSGAAPQTITITTTTAGATIYFTLDGSYPCSANAAALIYSSPVTISTPTTLRAAAEASGMQPSNIALGSYT